MGTRINFDEDKLMRSYEKTMDEIYLQYFVHPTNISNIPLNETEKAEISIGIAAAAQFERDFGRDRSALQQSGHRSEIREIERKLSDLKQSINQAQKALQHAEHNQESSRRGGQTYHLSEGDNTHSKKTFWEGNRTYDKDGQEYSNGLPVRRR